MAWNGSSKDATSESKPHERAHSPLRGLVAGSVVVIVAGVAAWCFLGRSQPVQQKVKSGESRLIAEVKPSLSTNASHSFQVAESSTKKLERPAQRVGEIRDGFILLSTGELYPVKGVITTRCERVSLEDRAFDRFSDRLIGSVLRTEPGEGLLGSSEELYEGFDKEFEESLAYPIVIKADDPDDIREMKQAVIDVRKELQNRKAKGENLERLMIDTRNQLLELASYRDELEAQVDTLMADNDFSENDAKDLLGAANKMLEERGAKPLDLPIAAIYSIRHMSDNTNTSE